ncbi:MAG: hypothetical protein WBQ89_06640 [Candidatus Acidiferrum sp.]
MVFTTLLLICCSSISGDVPGTPATSPAAETNTTTTPGRTVAAVSTPAKPDAPTPKAAEPSSANPELDLVYGGEAVAPAIQPALSAPAKPATTESYETPRQREFWYGLVVLGHGAAGFDAWTTRRAIGGGYGIEGDPLQRPFANSGAIYATTQVAPVIMDYLGHRMMRSSHRWIRKSWWVPQAASAGVSLGAGLHNYSVVP